MVFVRDGQASQPKLAIGGVAFKLYILRLGGLSDVGLTLLTVLYIFLNLYASTTNSPMIYTVCSANVF